MTGTTDVTMNMRVACINAGMLEEETVMITTHNKLAATTGKMTKTMRALFACGLALIAGGAIT